MIDRSTFCKPNFARPIDLREQKSLVIPGATVKGMQLQALVDECEKRGHPMGRKYRSFHNYPGEELVELLVEAGATVWPKQPAREGLRRLGRLAYPTLKDTMVGRVVFGVVGNDVGRLWPLVAKGYGLSGSHGSAVALEVEPGEAIIRLEDIYTFIDAWHLGILEGAVQVYGLHAEVLISLRSPTSADLLVRWDEALVPHVLDD